MDNKIFLENLCRILGHDCNDDGVCIRCEYNKYLPLLKYSIESHSVGMKRDAFSYILLKAKTENTLRRFQEEGLIEAFRNVRVAEHYSYVEVDTEVLLSFDGHYHFARITLQ